MRHRCPKCNEPLPEEDLRCGLCDVTYRTVSVGTTRVVDFLFVCAPNVCRCPAHLGDATCEIALDDLQAMPPGPKPYHHKSKILRPFLRYRGKVILDVGCREAPIGHLLAARNYLVGVDLCPGKMLGGDGNALDKGYRELLIADAANLPIADQQADLVIATDVLEHSARPETMVQEFRRALKPGGELIAAVPNLVSYNNRISILLGSGVGIELHQILKGRSPINPISGARYPDQRLHLRFFTLKSLAAMVEACGLVITRKLGYDPVLSRIPLADRILKRLCLVVGVIARKV